MAIYDGTKCAKQEATPMDVLWDLAQIAPGLSSGTFLLDIVFMVIEEIEGQRFPLYADDPARW
jgi:hypothetical protein